ncbi:MAG: hypothetical protein ACQGVC_26250 [Myxococcota bacterium]
MYTDSRTGHPPVARWRLAAPLLLSVVVVGVLVYPMVGRDLLSHVDPRWVGAVLLLGSGLTMFGGRGGRAGGGAAPRFGVQLGRTPGVIAAGLGLATVVTGERLPLLLVASWAYGVAAWVFWQSTRDGSSVIEQVARRIHPYAPDFIGPYCRKVTLLWAAFLGASALVLAGLAVAAPLEWWEGYTKWVIVPLSLAGSAVEYLVRKTWFRYYPYGGPIDRVFMTFFPAGATEAGRRSQAYIEQRRRELGAKPPPSG